ncbi:MAG: AcaB family transcriptional regulator [Cellvibrionaceae bacterium]
MTDNQTANVLKSHFAFTIHMPAAKNLVSGGTFKPDNKAKEYKVSGLEQFSQRLGHIWSGIKKDDPYAEMVLIEIERRIKKANSKIDHYETKAKQLLAASPPGVTIAPVESSNPTTIEFDTEKYYTIHSKLAATLIARFDYILRQLNSCIGLNNYTKLYFLKDIDHLSRPIRGALIAPGLYINMNVRRSDILENNKQGLLAVEKCGLVPLDILNNTQHSEYGPISR